MMEEEDDPETSSASSPGSARREKKVASPAGEDWEAGLDSFGVAKCGVCGMKLPLDAEEIEKHCLECEEAQNEGREVSDNFARSRTESAPARSVDILPTSAPRPLMHRASLLR